MIVRVNKTKDYTVMSNKHLQDRRLTLKAKGLLSVVLALPDNWKYSVSGLASISREKESSINSALKELKECGYLIITKKMPNETDSGRIEYEWDFYEQPQDEEQDDKKQDLENLGFEIQGLEIQTLENQGLYKNTNIVSTNEQNTNIENTDQFLFDGKPQKKKFIPPTVEEVRQYCLQRGNDIDPEEFVSFYAASNWYRGKTKITNWKQCIITWEKNRKRRTTTSGNPFTELLKQEGFT